MKRVHVFISGRVQGVFFRANTQDRALELGLVGYVKNLPDGRVEAVFEGDDKSIEKMLGFCREGPEGAVVENVEVLEEDFNGEFSGFKILS